MVGLWSMNLYMGAEPIARAATLTPGCTFLRELSMTPSLMRRITPSVMASVCRPRCWWCLMGFRVQAQMLVVLDAVEDGIGDASDANLQARPVRDL